MDISFIKKINAKGMHADKHFIWYLCIRITINITFQLFRNIINVRKWIIIHVYSYVKYHFCFTMWSVKNILLNYTKNICIMLAKLSEKWIKPWHIYSHIAKKEIKNICIHQEHVHLFALDDIIKKLTLLICVTHPQIHTFIPKQYQKQKVLQWNEN